MTVLVDQHDSHLFFVFVIRRRKVEKQGSRAS